MDLNPCPEKKQRPSGPWCRLNESEHIPLLFYRLNEAAARSILSIRGPAPDSEGHFFLSINIIYTSMYDLITAPYSKK